MSALDLAALRAAAEAATPGRYLDMQPTLDHEWAAVAQWETDAANEFRAAFDPPTALQLLDRLEAAERDAAHLQDTVDDYIARMVGDRCDANAEIGKLGTRIGELRARANTAEAKVMRVEALTAAAKVTVHGRIGLADQITAALEDR